MIEPIEVIVDKNEKVAFPRHPTDNKRKSGKLKL